MLLLSALLLPAASLVSADVPTGTAYQFQTPLTSGAGPLAAQACASLNARLPGLVSFPNSPSFVTQQENYYSDESKTQVPTCRVTPKHALHVSEIVKIAVAHNSPFAVKCGGTMASLGSANIGGEGFTIDLTDIKEVVVSKDRKTVSIGGGAIWTDVYDIISPQNISVSGGRAAGVGVGGFLSHGGISFLSHGTGFGSSSIVGYEVVIADGSVVQANAQHNPELYWSLKLGSTNYGIITRFDMEAKEQGDFFGGNMIIPNTDPAKKLFKHMVDWAPKVNQHPEFMSIVAIGYMLEPKDYWMWISTMYLEPVSEAPDLLSDILSVADKAIINTTGIKNLTQMALEIGTYAPGGGRGQWFSFTFKRDADLLWDIHEGSKKLFEPVKSRPGASHAMLIQPINSLMMKNAGRNGGSPLDKLPDSDEDLILYLGTLFWHDAQDDELMKAKNVEIIQWIEKTATDRGLLHPYRYGNYALRTEQDTYSAVGPENLARLQAAKSLYDPENVLGRLWKGGYKLPQ